MVQAALAAEAEEVKTHIADHQKEIESIKRNRTLTWENICHVTEERTIINKNAESDVRTSYGLKKGGRRWGGGGVTNIPECYTRKKK